MGIDMKESLKKISWRGLGLFNGLMINHILDIGQLFRLLIFLRSKNEMHGEGKFSWPDGRKYAGTYKNGKRDGYGEFRWQDGRVYKGNWQNGKQHGKGLFINLAQIERIGEWDEGKRIKWVRKNSQGEFIDDIGDKEKNN